MAGVPRRPVWALPLVVVAGAAVAVALVVAVRGLLANPVRSTDRSGVVTIEGSFEPYDCARGSCRGYVQAGGRSVFVALPAGCPQPPREATVTVEARPAPQLGRASYTALRCPAPREG